MIKYYKLIGKSKIGGAGIRNLIWVICLLVILPISSYPKTKVERYANKHAKVSTRLQYRSQAKNAKVKPKRQVSYPQWARYKRQLANRGYRITKIIRGVRISHYAPRNKKVRTFTGAKPDCSVIAVDPKLIKLGAMVFVPKAPSKQIRKAADTGGKIKGKRVDICCSTYRQAKNLGIRRTDIAIVVPIIRSNRR